ncbi:uncharacterized protein LOC124287044 [Haliotis rubra]|uniref:uncharacterized protein LOC124287044 n=1 Tax=Haliotis rubra TaxID=36100 RepID=UPI001EE5DD8B|nr:uncharacterized protein LOC124287044 [Haliotis rubra]
MLVSILLVSWTYSAALGSGSFEGSSFLLSYTPTGRTDVLEHMYLYLTANQNGTSCNVTSGSGSSTMLLDTSFHRYNLPETNHISTFGIYRKSAVEVSCTGVVQVYALFDTLTAATCAFGVIPVSSLSTDYIVPSVNTNPTLSIAASSDNTTVAVLFTSKCSFSYQNNMYHNGDNITVLLNSRDVFHIAHFGTSPSSKCDYHGTRVFSTSPVAVFYGSGYTTVDNACNVKLLDQITPVSSLGKDYVIPFTDQMDVNQVRIFAPQVNTSITLTEGDKHSSFSLQPGQIHVHSFVDDTIVTISSSRPISVQKFAGAYAKCTALSSIVPPINKYGHEYTVPDLQGYNHTFTRQLSIVVDSNCTNQISGNSHWRNVSVGGHQYSVTTLRAPATLTHLNTTPDCRFGIHVYGRSSVGGYDYNAVPMSDGSSNENNLQKAFTLVCETNNWVVEVNMDMFGADDHSSSNIFMSTGICHGIVRGHVLVFNYTYSDCNTHMKENGTDYIFTNYLVEYHVDPLTSLADRVLWRYDIQCLRPRHEVDFVTVSPVDVNNAIHVQSSSKVKGHQADIKLFNDSSFTNQISENHVSVNVGARVYVQVQTKSTADVKLVVDNCYISPDNRRDNSTMVSLIMDRCESNHFVHIIGSADKATRFSFDMFEIPRRHDFVYVTCDVSFCDVMDFSQECQNGCNQLHP